MVRSFNLRFANGSVVGSLAVALVLGLYCLAVVLSFMLYATAGVPLLLVASFALALAPVGIYVALRWPLIVPFCLYVLFLPFDSLSYTGGAGTVTKMLGMAAAAALFLRVLRPGTTVPLPRSAVAWLTLLALMSVSIFWSIEPTNATYFLQIYASLIALYTLLSVVRVRGFEFNSILACIFIAGVISGGYDAYLYRNSLSVINAGAGASRVIISAGGATIDPNELAFALVLPFSIGVYWVFNSRHVWLRLVTLPGLAILLYGFSASGSRGGFFALGAVFAYLIVRSRHRLWLGAMMLVSAVGALVANPGLPARFLEAQQDGGAGRGDIWRIGLYAFRDHWLIGAGIGNFPDAFDREYIHVFVRYVMGWHWVAHNVPLQVATELGVFGFAIYMIAMILQFMSLSRCWNGTALFELRLALEGSLIAIFVAGLSTSTLNAKFVWLVFSVMSLMRNYYLTNAATASLPDTKNRALKPFPRPVQPRSVLNESTYSGDRTRGS